MYLNSGLLGHVFEFRATGSRIWIPEYWVTYLNSGLLDHVFEFRTTGSRIWIPDHWVMYLNSGLLGHVFEFRTTGSHLNSGLLGHVFEFRTTGSLIWIPDYWVMYLNSGLLVRSHYAYRRSCDRPNWWGLSVYILGPRANSEFVPKFHISHSLTGLPVQISKVCPIAALPHSQSSVIMQPLQYGVQNSAQIQQMFNLFRVLHVKSCSILVPPRLLHFPTSYFASNFDLREEQMTTAWEPSEP
jgi:hypothetical protein